MSESVNINLSIDQGSDYSLQIYWTDAGDNPFTVLHPMRMDIKASTGQIIHSLTTEVSGDGQPDILYNSDSGLIQLTIPESATSLFTAGMYQYDLFVTYQDNSLGTTRRMKLLRGSVLVHGRVTESV